MPLSEFDIISKYFKKKYQGNKSIIAGIGDDAAIIDVPKGQQITISTDTLISGVHFPENSNPYDIGYKALAVNISDMAAMGSEPLYVTLSISLETNCPDWIQSFSEGFFSIADKYDVSLIGGDVTRGGLSITVQIIGLVPAGEAILRCNAKPGDNIYVTGELGMAGYALLCLNQGDKKIDDDCLRRLNRPEPRVATGMALRNIASACIDISDGLYADLSHLLEASSVGAEIELQKVPMHRVLNTIKPELAYKLGINSGDDYELCFTVSDRAKHKLIELENNIPVKLTKIGMVTDSRELIWKNEDGKLIDLPNGSYRHF